MVFYWENRKLIHLLVNKNLGTSLLAGGGGPGIKTLPANTGDTGFIPGWGTKILRTVQRGQIIFFYLVFTFGSWDVWKGYLNSELVAPAAIFHPINTRILINSIFMWFPSRKKETSMGHL